MSQTFNVYNKQGGKCIDTVFYSDGVSVDADEVKRSLVNHDGYDSGIHVCKARRKMKTEYTLQGFYNGAWEDLTSEETRREIHVRRQEYRENEPGTAYRIRSKRVPV